MIGSAVFFVSWTTVLSTVLNHAHGGAMTQAANLAYPVGDVVVASLVLILATRPGRGHRAGFALVSAGLVSFAVADSSCAYLTAGGRYGTGNVTDTGWVLGFFLVALGALWAWQRPAPQAPRLVHPNAWANAVPYLPFGAAVAVAAWRAVTHGSLDRVSQLTILVVVLVVAVRQMVVLSDNVALARQLEAKVERRTAQLHHREFHDGLTGLANRALFNQYLDNATQRQGRSGACLAVLVIDLYDFTGLNQLHGSAVGDELLCAVAARLQATLRGADTVARVGGDEFAALLEGPPAELCAERAAQRVLAGLEGPYVVGSNALTVEASIGVATYALGTTSGEVLVRNAGLAMHAAKERGRHCYEVYAEPVHSVIRERMQTEAELSGALDRRELVLHYQPVVAMAAGSVRGVEALVRWQHPERGLLAPDMFVPTAERTGLIVSIGAWVLHQACSDVVALTTEAQPLALSVNLSARQLEDEDLVAMVRRALTDCGFEAHRLTLEVTESAIMADVARAAYVLQELRELGAKIAIDDFGTGYSTLSALRHLPVDTLKIDKSFVADIAHDRASEDLVRRTLQLASDFCLHTVAEGVEGPEQLEALRRLGCRSAQGFFFSRPIPVEELHSLLQDRPDGWSGRAPRSPLPNTRAGLLKHCS